MQARSFFDNPYVRLTDHGEQKILEMFWKKGENSIQKTWLLTKSMRTDDEWLQVVLGMARYGTMSWEVYCFIHGLPTRHCGSWLPKKDLPACGHQACADLANGAWQDMLPHESSKPTWSSRQSMECHYCQRERERRCWIIHENAVNETRYMEEPFVDAPYVHPFRQPSFHAQQLRAMNFAKARGRRIMWMKAVDRLCQQERRTQTEKEAQREEKWLTYHDRYTSGIHGLFPLILDLPVRFTDPPRNAYGYGIFKNSQGFIRGWRLDDADTKIMSQDVDAGERELALRKLPVSIFVEVPSANALLPVVDNKKIYEVKFVCKTWTLCDHIKIQRLGYPFVPDFGGTAHAYCGSTLNACIGDLLQWIATPRREDALRAYIIISRVRQACRFLIAQPFNPNLFQLGVLPGPDLLMKVLTDRMTPKEAEREWQKIVKNQQEKATSDRLWWMQKMMLPCRRCTDQNKGMEVKHPLSLFTTISPHDMEKIWKRVFAQGADLICFPCRHQLAKDAHTVNIVPCTNCAQLRPRRKFQAKFLAYWDNRQEEPLRCKDCSGVGHCRSQDDMLLCTGPCHGANGRLLAEHRFLETDIVQQEVGDVKTAVRCVRCVLTADDDMKNIPFTCDHCGQSKTLQHASYSTVKDWLLHLQFRNSARSCYACHFPPCTTCGNEPDAPLPPQERVKMRQGHAYMCANCSRRRCLTCNTVLVKHDAATQYCSQCIAQQRWHANYERLLEAIKANNGDLPQPQRNSNLKRSELWIWAVNWCKEQRKYYHAKNLATERIALLQNIPGWTWTPGEDAAGVIFAKNLEAWQEYYAKHGKHPPYLSGVSKWLRKVRENPPAEFLNLPKHLQELMLSPRTGR